MVVVFTPAIIESMQKNKSSQQAAKKKDAVPPKSGRVTRKGRPQRSEDDEGQRS